MAQTGTAMIMPKTPQKPPPIRIEMMIRKLDTPVVSPRIFGPKKFPSNCCRRTTKIRKYSACRGSIRRISRRHGTAPRNGPKNGMIFVTPMITLTSSAYGVPIRLVTR